MEPPYPSLTATWHNDTYPAIDPKQKQLSQAGKTVVITGAWDWAEANVKGIVVTAQAFIPTAKSSAAMYAMASGSTVLPPRMTPYLGGYQTSKIAQMRVMEFLAAENPQLFVCSVHPGFIDTSIFRRAGATPDALPMDTVTLPAHFLVWLTQPKTKFLHGKMVFANWDVDEMCEKAEEIQSTEMLTLGCVGWPFVKTS